MTGLNVTPAKKATLHFILSLLFSLVVLPQLLLGNEELWKQIPNTKDMKVNVLAIDSTGNYFAGTEQGLYKSTDKGSTWNLEKLESDSLLPVYSMVVTSKNESYISTSKGIFKLDSNPSKWLCISKDITNTDYSFIVKTDRDDIYAKFKMDTAQFYEFYLYKLDIKSNKWNILGGKSNVGFTSAAMNLLFVYYNDSFFRYDIEKDSLIRIYYDQYKTIVRSNNNILISGDLYNNYQNGSVSVSTDSGLTWRQVPIGMGNPGILALEFVNREEIIAGTMKGIFYSNNTGESWHDISNNLVSQRISAILINRDSVICGTDSGLFIRQIPKVENKLPFSWEYVKSYKQFKASELPIKRLYYKSNDTICLNGDMQLKYFTLDSLRLYKSYFSDTIPHTLFINSDFRLSPNWRFLSFYIWAWDGYTDRFLVYDIQKFQKFEVVKPYINNYCEGVSHGTADYEETNESLYFGLSGDCRWKYTQSNGTIAKVGLQDSSYSQFDKTKYPFYYDFKVSPLGLFCTYSKDNITFLIDSNLILVNQFKRSSNYKLIRFSPDSKYIVFAQVDSIINIYTVPDLTLVNTIYFPDVSSLTDLYIYNQNKLITVTNTGEIKVWNLKQNVVADKYNIDNYSGDIKITPIDDTRFLTYGYDGYVRMFNSTVSSVNDIPDEYAKNEFSIYPNPASNELHLNFKGTLHPEDILKIEVFNNQGMKIKEITDYSITDNAIILDCSMLLPGGYNLILRSNNKVYHSNFVVYR